MEENARKFKPISEKVQKSDLTRDLMKVNLGPLVEKAKQEEKQKVKVNGHRTRMVDGV